MDPQPALMFVPSGSSWSTSTVAPRARSTFGRHRAWRRRWRSRPPATSPRARARRSSRSTESAQRFDRRGAVDDRADGVAGAGRRRALVDEQRVQLRLERRLDVVGELPATRGEQLHAVVLEPVVRRRDHRARPTPSAAASHATAGVGTTPSAVTCAPSDVSPATSADSSNGPEQPGVAPDDELPAARAPAPRPDPAPAPAPASGRGWRRPERRRSRTSSTDEHARSPRGLAALSASSTAEPCGPS